MNRKLIMMYLDDDTETQVRKIENVISFGFGDDQVSMSKELAETIFTQLDNQLHEPTITCEYMKNELSEKEDIIFDLQQELEDSRDLVGELETIIQEAM